MNKLKSKIIIEPKGRYCYITIGDSNPMKVKIENISYYINIKSEMKKIKLKDRRINFKLEVCNPDDEFFSIWLKVKK